VRLTDAAGGVIWDVDPVRGQDIGAVQTAANEAAANAAAAQAAREGAEAALEEVTPLAEQVAGDAEQVASDKQVISAALLNGDAFTAATVAEAITAGLAAVSEGEYFIATGDDIDEVRQYRDVGGVATLIFALPKIEAVEAQVALAEGFRDEAEEFATTAGSVAGAQAVAQSAALDMFQERRNYWLDQDMTGKLGSGWFTAAMAAEVMNGRPVISNPGTGLYFAKCPLPPVAEGEPFTVSYAIEAADVTGDIGIFIAQLNSSGGQIAGTTEMVTTLTEDPDGPKPYFHVRNKAAGAVELQFVLFTNQGTDPKLYLSQIGLYAGEVDAYAPEVNGRAVELFDHLSGRDALAEMWLRPNVMTDPGMTGQAGVGWGAATTVVTLPTGRRAFEAVGVARNMGIPVGRIGPAGTEFSASCVVEQLTSADSAVNRVSVLQIRGDGTPIDGTFADFVNGSQSWTRPRRQWLAGMTVHADATTVIFSIDASADAENVIRVSLVDVHVGDNPAYRPPLPDSKLVGKLLAPLLSGSTANRPTGMPANWTYFDTSIGNFVIHDGSGGWDVYAASTPVSNADFYVDSVAGSDDNHGKTKDAPFKSLTKAMLAVGSAPNKIVAVKRGSVFRNQPMYCTGAGLRVGVYGDPDLPAPRSLGSEAITSFTLVTGTVYSVPRSYEPWTVAMVAPDGTITKLYLDADGGNPEAGEWSYDDAGDRILFNAGFNPAGYTLQVPYQRATAPSSFPASGRGFEAGAADQTVEGIIFDFWDDMGCLTTQPNTQFLDVWCRYCGGDGFDQFFGATNFLIQGGGAMHNGRRFNGLGGPGDGSSAHDLASGTIRLAAFIGNTQTGVGNLADNNVLTERCYFEDNQVDYQVYNEVGGSPGDHTVGVHTCRYSIFVHKTRPTNWFATFGNSVPTTEVNMHNATVWYDPSLSEFLTFFTLGMNVDVANCVLVAPSGFSFAGARYGGVLTSRNNSLFGPAAAWQAGFLPTSETGLLTTDPQLIDPANGNFGLKAASPAVGTGVDLDYTADYYGNPVAAIPCRGAVERL
jgi:hypothetical protein